MDYKKQKEVSDMNLGKTSSSVDKKQGVAHKIGDAIEKAGDFVSEKVSKKAGAKISELGDKIEHSRD